MVRLALVMSTSAALLFGSCSLQLEPAPELKRIIATPAPTATPKPKPQRTSRSDAPVALHPARPQGPASDIPWPWIAIADCESGDGPRAAGPPYHPKWDYHGPTYDGGLNFLYSTWDRAWELRRRDLDRKHGRKFRVTQIGSASLDAWRHSAIVQVRVAIDWLSRTSWSQWPVCSRAVGVR